jgi:selenoprotein W-related protein
LKATFGVSCTLVPSRGGVFEVSVDGKAIFSKRALDRFPEDGEIVELIRAG